AEDRGDGRQDQRADRHLQCGAVQDPGPRIEIPVGEGRGAGAGAGGERIHHDDAERDGEEEDQIQVRGEADQETSSAFGSLRPRFEVDGFRHHQSVTTLTAAGSQQTTVSSPISYVSTSGRFSSFTSSGWSRPTSTSYK